MTTTGTCDSPEVLSNEVLEADDSEEEVIFSMLRIDKKQRAKHRQQVVDNYAAKHRSLRSRNKPGDNS